MMIDLYTRTTTGRMCAYCGGNVERPTFRWIRLGYSQIEAAFHLDCAGLYDGAKNREED